VQRRDVCGAVGDSWRTLAVGGAWPGDLLFTIEHHYIFPVNTVVEGLSADEKKAGRHESRAERA
jgi:hypothetical protein